MKTNEQTFVLTSSNFKSKFEELYFSKLNESLSKHVVENKNLLDDIEEHKEILKSFIEQKNEDFVVKMEYPKDSMMSIEIYNIFCDYPIQYRPRLITKDKNEITGLKTELYCLMSNLDKECIPDFIIKELTLRSYPVKTSVEVFKEKDILIKFSIDTKADTIFNDLVEMINNINFIKYYTIGKTFLLETKKKK